MTSNAPYRWLKTQSAQSRLWFFLSIALGMFIGILIVLQAGLLSWILARVYLYNATYSSLSTTLFLLLLVILARALCVGLRDGVSHQTAQIVKNHIRESLFSHVMKFKPQQLAQYKTGALTTTFIEQIEVMHGFFSDYLPQLFLAIAVPFFILTVIAIQNWVAGMILLITGPLIPVFMRLIGSGVATLNQKNFQRLSKMSAHFLDLLQGLTTLTLFNQSRTPIQSISTVSDHYRQSTMRVLRVAFLSSAVLELFSTVSIALIAVYLGLGLLGLMHIGFHGVPISLQIALFILLLTSEFFAPLRQLGAFYHARAGAIGAAKEIMPILGQNVTKNDVPFILPEKFSIKLNHISFAYRAQKPVIDKMNLEIHSAEMVAIRGPSGSGKTTLLYLVAKLILPQTGTIEVNNTNIELVSDDAWRKNIALLTQHPYFFHGSILENIKLAHPAATDEDVERVAHEAGVLEWSRLLPQGLHTIIGEKNAGLSGGQAQRVALARVLLKEAPIVLLDEPTAFLDEKNIEIIFNLFKKWKKQKTVLIATHDARVEKQVDRIIQLSEEKNERIMVFH